MLPPNMSTTTILSAFALPCQGLTQLSTLHSPTNSPSSIDQFRSKLPTRASTSNKRHVHRQAPPPAASYGVPSRGADRDRDRDRDRSRRPRRFRRRSSSSSSNNHSKNSRPRPEPAQPVTHPFPADDPRVPLPPPLPPVKYGDSVEHDSAVDEDDEFWEFFRVQTMAFRAGTTLTPDMLQPAEPRPVDRFGNEPEYPAAVHLDVQTNSWVATTEEQERLLREPTENKDPYCVQEAMLPHEMPTSLRPPPVSNDTDTEHSDGEDIDRQIFDPFAKKKFNMNQHRRLPLNMDAAAWRVVHLGTSSAMPTRKRNVSSTAILIDRRKKKSISAKQRTTNDNDDDKKNNKYQTPAMFLVDAGESTDSRLLHCDWCMTHGFRWINAIFITHLHGDHIYGLPKLLWSIGEYAQHRRRAALENGDDGSDPVIRIFGPYGTRGFLRASLHWTNPIGVRFSVSELVPRPSDFLHLGSTERWNSEGQQIIIHDTKSGDVSMGSGLDPKACPPPLKEEVRAENVSVSEEDGLWHLWEEECEDGRVVEVVAAPLKHRMPCFGYVFRERHGVTTEEIEDNSNKDASVNEKKQSQNAIEEFEIDKVKAKELGVYGSQFRVLRSGRSVKITKTGRIVTPQEVCVVNTSAAPPKHEEQEQAQEKTSSKNLHQRKITILGDTCDSSMIAEAAHGCELLVHEATFAQKQADKARIAMHSTAYMAGAFGKQVQAKRIALTHFSSRYEAMFMDDEGSATNRQHDHKGRGRGGIVFVDDEDIQVDMDRIIDNNDLSDGQETKKDGNESGIGQVQQGCDEGEGDNGEEIFGVFTDRSSGESLVDVLGAFDDVIHDHEGDGEQVEDEDEDEDYVSANLLVHEACKGFGDGDVQIVAAHDFMEHDIALTTV